MDHRMVGAHWSFGFEVLHDAVSPALRYVQFRVTEPRTHGFGVLRFQHSRFNVWCFLYSTTVLLHGLL